MNNGVAAIVVTYNRRALLAECIECLQRQRPDPPDILVIDNSSTDGTGEALAPLIDSGAIRYENTGRNLGGAGGFQYGMRRAVELGYDYLWVMDDDSMPEPSALSALMDAARALGEFGFLSGRALWTDGRACLMNRQRDLKMNNIADYAPRRIPCGAATFVSLLVPSGVVRRVGLPIGAFFIWADDLEYTRRISRRYPCYVITDSVTVHKCPTNNGGNISTDEVSRIERYRYAYRNEVYVYRREGLRGFVRLVLRTPLHILRVLTRAPSHRLRRIGVIVGGTLQGLSFRPEIEYVDDADKHGGGQ